MPLAPQSPLSVFPLSVIPMKAEMAYKILERGRVRFWVQAESISSAVTYKFFANNKELANCEVRDRRGRVRKRKKEKEGHRKREREIPKWL